MATLTEIVQSFRDQAQWCEKLGSPFTSRLLEYAAEDLAQGGSLGNIIGRWHGDPHADALPLRFAGALHALALSGIAPELTAAFPPCAIADKAKLWPVAMAAIDRHPAQVEAYLASPPQTNEVRRSAVLLGGFLEIARLTRLPLRLLEIGASAGLNLGWTLYRYDLGGAVWGDLDSPVLMTPQWRGSLPPLGAEINIAERAGCDMAPIDLNDPKQRLRLKAYVWADQRDRLDLLDKAIDTVSRLDSRRTSRCGGLARRSLRPTR